jgi:hypothetical protein
VIRIFSSFAVLSLLCVAAAFFLGIYAGDVQSLTDRNVPASTRETIKDRAAAHFIAGVGAALVVILANSISVTYFIGTSRWCKEVVERYSLDRDMLKRSQSLKRRTFPWAVLSMLAMVGVVALGAAADPGTGMPNTSDWVLPHFLAGLFALAFVGFSFFVQAMNIRAHYDVINEIVADVRKVRIERGLEV